MDLNGKHKTIKLLERKKKTGKPSESRARLRILGLDTKSTIYKKKN